MFVVNLQTRGKEIFEDNFATSSDLPHQVPLHDDVLLETVSVFEKEVGKEERLPSLHAACILASCLYERGTEPDTEIMYEKCTTYLSQVQFLDVDRRPSQIEIFF